MRRPERARRAIVGLILGVVAGAVAGGTVAATRAATGGTRAALDEDPAKLIAATHLPPLLTMPGEPVTLGFDVYCAPPGSDPEDGRPCDAGGTVYVRTAGMGAFRAVALRLQPALSQGRYVAELPPEIVAEPHGFEYYAVLRSRTTGATTVLPSGGPFAPLRSRPLPNPVEIALGQHAFGSPANPVARVAAATWGSGEEQAGLEAGGELQRVGASSFDVGVSGAVSLLDEANQRVLRFDPGRERPVPIPVAVRGTIADLAVDTDGVMAVLETVADGDETPVLHTFDPGGRLRTAVHVAERTTSTVEIGPDGPVVLEYPSGQWMPVTERGAGLSAGDQRRRARSGRPTRDGAELVVQRADGELRVAEVDARAVRRGWRVTSATSLGEIQLVRRLGRNVVVAFRVYTETRDEFDVLVLGDRGLVRRFSVDSTAWAETAPLARLRLRGSSLYALGSTPAGVYVDRYDLGVG